MANMRLLLASILLGYLITFTEPVSGLAVMSVDFGSEWMKVAIVSVSSFSALIVHPTASICSRPVRVPLPAAWRADGNSAE